MIKSRGFAVPSYDDSMWPSFIFPNLSALCDYPDIASALVNVMTAIGIEMYLDGLPTQSMPINCVYTIDSILPKLKDSEIACSFRIAYFPMEKLAAFRDSNILFSILAEELCHLIWDISDETIIKLKVLSVLRNLNPSLEIGHLHNKETAPKLRAACQALSEDQLASHPFFLAL